MADQKVLAALKLAADCILDAAKEAGQDGVPSGPLYAVLAEHGMTLNVYQQIVDFLVSQGEIVVRNHCITLA